MPYRILPPFNTDRSYLYDLYWNQNKTESEIGVLFGCCRKTIEKWLKKQGIPRRSSKERIALIMKKYPDWQKKRIAKLKKFSLTKEELYNMYWKEGKSLSMIALLTNFHRATVGAWMRHYGIDRRGQHGHTTHSTHKLIVEKLSPELRARENKVVCLTVNSNKGYSPDFVVLREEKLYSYEVETGPSGKLTSNKIEHAKKAGFDGVIFYYYFRKNKKREEVIDFGDTDALS